MYKARVTFWGDGGRSKPPHTGYHPQIKIGSVFTSCIIDAAPGTSVFAFDKEYEVKLRLMSPELCGERLHVGDQTHFFEGSKQVASGVVIAELDECL